MSEQRVVPEVRFAGFADPWEQRKLGECGVTYSGLSGKTKEDFGHGDALFIPYTNVFDNPISDVNRLEAVEIDSRQNEVRQGDVLFTVSSETPEEVGMSSVWPANKPNVYLNSFCFGYRQDGTFDSDYLAYMLRSVCVRDQLTLLAQGISRFNISKNKVMELSVPAPSTDEQQTIGRFFSRFDSLITLHQRKHDKLVVLKKTMLEKMFPKEGESVPEVRFAGFTDPWERRKFMQEFVFLKNNTLSRANLSDENGDVLDVHYGDVLIRYGSVLDLATAKLPRIADDATAWNLACDDLEDGDVVIADTAEDLTAGKCSELRNIGALRVFSGLHTMPCRPVKQYAPGFLGHYLNAPAFHNQLVPLMQGIKVIALSRAAMANAVLAMPSVGEQKLISDTLSCLDSLITLHQRKLELLKNIKQSMLDKMFV